MFKKVKKMGNLSLVLVLAGFLLLGFAFGVNAQKLGYLSGLDSFGGFAATTKDSLSARDLARMLKNKNFTLINVHTPYTGEIAQTDTFVAYDQLLAASDNLPKDKNAPIILYCETGRMSTEAVETMKKMGYTNVRHLAGGLVAWKASGGKTLDLSKLETEVLPDSGVEMPVKWGDLGPKLVAAGVIDLAKFKQAVKPTPDQEAVLTKATDKNISINRGNVQFVVDVLWALGLAQKSVVYDEGPMGTQYKSDAGNFASTGGWTLAAGNAMNYYNRFDLVTLNPEQQKRVAEISKNVYRPCCGNSTYFPDCNHGMAALAMIELMVAQGMDDKTIYKNILAFNAFWFPDNYLTVATYFARQGTAWKDIDAKVAMGEAYSSGQGSASLAQKVGQLPWRTKNTSGCGA